MENTVKIFGFGGSLRKGSYSRVLLEAAKDIVPQNASLEIFEGLEQIPAFNQDQEQNLPEIVTVFKDKIKDADAILISTPEYNYSIPGFLKNAIDWASRPYGSNSFEDKPVAIISSSGGILGGSRAYYQLRQTFVFLNMHALNKPEVIVPFVAEKVQDGKLTDQHTKDKIQELLVALVAWSIRLKK